MRENNLYVKDLSVKSRWTSQVFEGEEIHVLKLEMDVKDEMRIEEARDTMRRRPAIRPRKPGGTELHTFPPENGSATDWRR